MQLCPCYAYFVLSDFFPATHNLQDQVKCQKLYQLPCQILSINSASQRSNWNPLRRCVGFVGDSLIPIFGWHAIVFWFGPSPSKTMAFS